MAVTFVVGRAGSGKTHACRAEVLAELARPGDGRLLLLVPEQASFEAERALALSSPAGGYTRAEVLSFSRLARRVLAATGAEPEEIGAEARVLALRAIVRRAAQELPVLGRAALRQGFCGELSRVIEELLREDVSPGALRAAAEALPGGADGVRELARLYGDYQAWLGSRVDAAARLGAVRERLDRLPWLTEAAVWVDGFAGFTGQELSTLVELARRARAVTIALLADPASPAIRNPRQAPDPLRLFERTEHTYQQVRAALEAVGVAVMPTVERVSCPRFSRSAALAALEQGLAAPDGALPGPSAQPGAADPRASGAEPAAVRIVECATRRDELRAAARWIRASIADSGGGLRYRDFAVIAREIEPLAPLVSEVFDEYELPHFVDRRRPLHGHPLSRLVPGLLEAVQTDLAVGPMVRLLRTRLLPLSDDAAERLETLLIRERVRGSAAWRTPGAGLGLETAADAALGRERTDIVAGLEPLGECVRQAAVPGRAWAAALCAALERLHVAQRLDAWILEARAARRWAAAETHRLAWDALGGVLEDIHGVLADVPLTADDLVAVLRAALGELTLGIAPPALDQVLVSGIERSRHPDIRRAWVLGLNEGVFPARPAEDRLLSTVERAALAAVGLAAPRSHQDDALGERLLAYIAFTRPSERLVVSYATVADDGSELLASPLLADVRGALPAVPVERAETDAPPVHVAELARGFLAARGRERRKYERLVADVRRAPARAVRLDRLLRGRNYDNSCRSLPCAGPAPGVAWEGSPSQIETFIQCPFQYFLSYRLRLDPQSGPRPVRWDLGTLAHEALADTTRRALREPGGVVAVSDERWQALLEEALAAQRARQPIGLAERRPELAFLGGLAANFLREVVRVHAARLRRGRFAPRACEQRFGTRRPALPPLVLARADGVLRLQGVIDRVDVGCDADGRRLMIVYDYKSGAGSLGGSVLTGARLQLFLYLLALEQAWAAEGVIPAGLFLAPLYPDPQTIERAYAAGASAEESLMYLYRPRGLVEERAARLLDTQLGTRASPVAALQLTKSGSFYKKGDACAAGVLAARLEQARATLILAAEGIAAGCLDIAPLVERRTLACGRCEFRPVCRFERAYNRPRAAEAVLPGPGPAGAGAVDDEEDGSCD